MNTKLVKLSMYVVKFRLQKQLIPLPLVILISVGTKCTISNLYCLVLGCIAKEILNALADLVCTEFSYGFY